MTHPAITDQQVLVALENYVTTIATAGGGDKQLFMAAIRQADDKARAAIAALRARIEGGGEGVPADYLARFMGKGEGIVRRFYNDEDQSVVDAGAWIQEANQLLQRYAATSPPSTPEPAGRVEAQGEWPADLSSTQRTKPQRFAYIWRDDGEPVIDDDDFKFDALITVHGDFDEGEKERYVAEVVRRLNGAAPTAPQAAELSEDEWIGKCIADELGSVDSIYEYARLHKFARAVLAKAGIPASPKAGDAPPPPPLEPK
jgi:hypothetical protein